MKTYNCITLLKCTMQSQYIACNTSAYMYQYDSINYMPNVSTSCELSYSRCGVVAHS